MYIFEYCRSPNTSSGEKYCNMRWSYDELFSSHVQHCKPRQRQLEVWGGNMSDFFCKCHIESSYWAALFLLLPQQYHISYTSTVCALTWKLTCNTHTQAKNTHTHTLSRQLISQGKHSWTAARDLFGTITSLHFSHSRMFELDREGSVTMVWALSKSMSGRTGCHEKQTPVQGRANYLVRKGKRFIWLREQKKEKKRRKLTQKLWKVSVIVHVQQHARIPWK